MDFCLISPLVFLLLLLSGTGTQASESAGHQWSYSGADGPSHWAESYPECGGSHQSPINIDTTNTEENNSWSPFSFQDYDVYPSSMNILNNGHTVQVSASMSSPPTLSGGGLGSEYTFKQLHFHWGEHAWSGSEHKVDGNSYPNELHLVHIKASKTDPKQADGIAVLGILLDIGSTNNPKLSSIVDGLDNVEIAGTESSIIPFALGDLLPDNRDEFYRYMGSLTTPPCNETVIWTVFKEPLSISRQQMNKFRHLEFEDGLKMVDNFRPDQPLNDRTVYHAILN